MAISQFEAAQLVLRICEGHKPTSEEQRLLSEIVSLDLHHSSIDSLNGLHYLTDLQSLDLSFVKINTLEGINALTNLQYLSLLGTKVGSLKPLNGLTNLCKLHLSYAKVGSLEGLGGLTNLRWLNLNHIESISKEPLALEELSSLVNLENLYISGTSLDSIPQWLIDRNLPLITDKDWGYEPGVYMKDVQFSEQPDELYSKSREEIEAYSYVTPYELHPKNYNGCVCCEVRYDSLPENVIRRLANECFEKMNCLQRWSNGFCIDERDGFGSFALCNAGERDVLSIDVYQVRDDETADPRILLRSILKKLKKINNESGLNATAWICLDDL